MASFGTNETELHGVFDAFRLVLAAKAGKTDSIIDTLRRVLVAHIKDHTVFPTVEQ